VSSALLSETGEKVFQEKVFQEKVFQLNDEIRESC